MRHAAAALRCAVHELGDALEGAHVRRDLADLAAEVHVVADELQPRIAGDARDHLASALQFDAELAVALRGRDVGVRVDGHGRVHAEVDRHAPRLRRAGGGEQFELVRRLHLERAHAERAAELDLPLLLRGAREHRARRVDAGLLEPQQLAAAHEVEAGAERCEQAQDGEVGVRLDRVADVRRGPERRAHLAEPVADAACAVDVERRAVPLRQVVDANVLAPQVATAVGEPLGARHRTGARCVEGRHRAAHAKDSGIDAPSSASASPQGPPGFPRDQGPAPS